ncbi:zinc finger MYM-type protein 5 isoform X2 [Erinaceus europaeus]|uniref:Zinc finger MYM-type protein 5 isoform X2 n=1 Tax=Erinaceus europaeus TaxID=9365 RepID=A0ABM3XPI2_ERIEU|nr:zinc finger MYM-type protein 5 isoform X2 [Erinaceus europaeus]
MDKFSVGGLKLTEPTPVLLGSTAISVSHMEAGISLGDTTNPLVNRSRNSSMPEDEDDDVVFVESIQPPSTSAPTVTDQRNISRHEKLQGNDSLTLPSSRDLASQKGSVSETIIIDDEEDIETNGGNKKNSFSCLEWGLPGTKNRTNDFSTTSLSRSKTKNAVGPFNPGRMSVAGGEFQKGGLAAHHSPGQREMERGGEDGERKRDACRPVSLPVKWTPPPQVGSRGLELLMLILELCTTCV